SPGRIEFAVRNERPDRAQLRFELDSYVLPREPMRAESFRERQSLAYLRRLQSANDRRKHPVPEFLDPRFSHESPELESGEERELSLTFEAPSDGRRHAVNV